MCRAVQVFDKPAAQGLVVDADHVGGCGLGKPCVFQQGAKVGWGVAGFWKNIMRKDQSYILNARKKSEHLAMLATSATALRIED